MSKNKHNKLLDANSAVASYLDNLLQEATEPKAKIIPVIKTQEKVQNVHIIATPLAQATLLQEEAPVELDNEQENTQVAPKEQDSEQEEVCFLDKSETLTFPVQCLMFRVGGQLLSIPLVKMGSVVPFAGKLTQLPYSPSYFKGLLKHRDRNIKVADSAAFLMGEKSEQVKDFKPSHLLVLEDENWAISCDELLDVVTLKEDDIKWHDDKNKRLSLGTIKTSLALVLSPEAICYQLTHSEQKGNKSENN